VSQAFQRFEGCSVGEYLRRLHVSRARALLAEGRTSLAQVARECGFYDQSHLTRVFRRYLGVTPAVFRNQGGRSA
jgi:AraC family transcriptional regulator